MLTEYKRLYEANANATLGKSWKTENINNLWRACNGDVNSPYMNAIIVRYWSCIDKLVFKSKPFFNEGDCYSWYIDSIMYVIQKHVWDNPENKLYGDNSAPDKAFHVHLSCMRATAFQQNNRYKRKANATFYNDEYIHSSDVREDNVVDHVINSFHFKDKVIDLFNKKDYFPAFMLDEILSQSLEDVDGNFNTKLLAKNLKTYNDTNCLIFSEKYGINLGKVKDAIKYVTCLPLKEINNRIEKNLFLYKVMGTFREDLG